MADVYPFKGYRYNSEQVGDINNVVTQPYDKIDESAQERYYKASPYNIVRIILGKEENGENRYRKAADYLDEWTDREIIIRDQEPGFYAYWQEYEVDGIKRIRKGFVGLGKLESGDGVKAHESTMEGPKADRLKLIRATEANFGHIFMLYSDPGRKIISTIDKGISDIKSTVEVNDEDGNTHKLWKIQDEDLINTIQSEMKDKSLYIADGHHRYQTALNYKNECMRKGWVSSGTEGFNNRLMTFINIDDPGLTILATHRLLYGVKDFDEDKLLARARGSFKVEEFNSKEEMYTKLDSDKGENPIFGFCTSNKDIFWTLTLRDNELMDKLVTGHSSAWENLDVTILHKAILEGYLGIDEEALAEKRNLDYVRYRDRALEKLDSGKYQAAFILNPTRVEEVQEIADKGEKMPQKSTDFYPKLLTGMVFHKLTIEK